MDITIDNHDEIGKIAHQINWGFSQQKASGLIRAVSDFSAYVQSVQSRLLGLGMGSVSKEQISEYLRIITAGDSIAEPDPRIAYGHFLVKVSSLGLYCVRHHPLDVMVLCPNLDSGHLDLFRKRLAEDCPETEDVSKQSMT